MLILGASRSTPRSNARPDRVEPSLFAVLPELAERLPKCSMDDFSKLIGTGACPGSQTGLACVLPDEAQSLSSRREGPVDAASHAAGGWRSHQHELVGRFHV